MSIIPCTFSALSDLEELVVELQAHSLALDLLVMENHTQWTNIHTCLLFNRLDALRQTAEDFRPLQENLLPGHNPESTPSSASDTPSA